ncbi:arsenate reductase family protein [Roseomonas aerophila]|uniref:Arsenate reductase n=1 Tax=Teichococcus aerophilus TaxID=1224513 RepID=A0ABR7RPW0_9PROT|nr:arsenate reductase family protein [Pseudoroseomonas aerophila]MBC9208604.1 arsenate reductase family protein [Pseudoroseomonas aerophila]
MADSITIYHNPACGTSRTVLAALREAGHEPLVVEYLKAGWTRPQLQRLLAAMGATPRDILRAKEAPDLPADASDDAILDAMVARPVLVNRPIVITPRGTRLCRPADTVASLL